ncbi:hypothetical protein [Pseudomonas sp. GD03944]|uniref:DUF6896 domain-containing protein n=1 Tax=Pseudomonas sp. GD03944 TaxID=2975409 RepID=UPI0024479526|nr:hypothetical protein [Pseudomonas sp. GD03944]MDH1265030.1 hypothetical protein [Pseudomonas sp. GD03944]
MKSSVDMNAVLLLVRLQCRLMLEFSALYPSVKDFKWLLDFPASGEVLVDGRQWWFVKHGAGLRFEKKSCEPHWVVDIHRYVDEPRIIDDWRLLQFFESCGGYVDKNEVLYLLGEMCSKGYLLDQGDGNYFLRQ